ncbi:MAG TPA: DUF4198 domain-containing protein [Gemmatimonadaceae bacterium]|nr:DUF4198 domain-containing protein [Gemmatimonadaceae bacterium]
MKWRYVVAVIAVAGTATVLQAHDFFFRANSFFVTPGATVHLRALNGTFSKSENSITRDRLRDLSVVGPGGHDHPDTASWSTTGDTSVLTVKVGAQGTYVVGASLKPREITLKSPDFNKYLADDGIPDILALRKKKAEMGKDATERYSKHIKALVQAGSKRDGNYATILGYPAELVPLDNPYSVRAGGSIRVRSMVDGKPAGNQLIVSGGRTPAGGRFPERRVHSDASGVARVPLPKSGQWYVKFIHMVPFTGAEKIDYESKWATLTFEVK